MAISKKLQDFLVKPEQPTPCLVVDLDKVRTNYDGLTEHLAIAQCYYSVKSNSSKHVLKALAEKGSAFEAASIGEVEQCLSVGIDVQHIHFGNTIKTVTSIKQAYQHGVASYAFDSHDELVKIAEHAPNSSVICRLATDGIGATWGLCNKFGCNVEQAIELLIAANKLNMSQLGISFHVGSQQKSPLAWQRALQNAKAVADALAEHDLSLDIINLGGGFPASGYLSKQGEAISYQFEQYGQAITDYIKTIFANYQNIRFICEPGRYLLAEAGCIKSQVILAADRSSEQHSGRWLYLDVGKFNGLYEATDIKHPVICQDKHQGQLVTTILAGPSCDSDDMLSMKDDYHQLPADIKAGDYLIFASTGAYSNSYASVGFNGIPPLTEFYI